MTGANWQQYQEEVAQFFRDLGLGAETNATLVGVRTHHAVDVFVTSMYKGVPVKWIIECKLWQRPVSKVHVLALRSIVEDVGADRGFVMAESGHQAGAREAAYLTNIQLTSLSDLRETCRHELAMMRVRNLYLRQQECRTRYWGLSKDVRIQFGLRPDVFDVGYSGNQVLAGVELALQAAIFSGFPVTYDKLLATLASSGTRLLEPRAQSVILETPGDLADYITVKLDELESLLTKAECHARHGG